MNIMNEGAKKVLNAATRSLYALDADQLTSVLSEDIADALAAGLIEVSMQLVEDLGLKNPSPHVLLVSDYLFGIAAQLASNPNHENAHPGSLMKLALKYGVQGFKSKHQDLPPNSNAQNPD